MNKPLVSVIITTRNRAKLLSRAIKSVLQQTYENIEIIVVDDASCDDTESVVCNFQKKDQRIVYIKNEQHLGSNPSRNKAIKQARGEYIAGLDDDDLFIENRIELLLSNYDAKFAFITSNNFLSQAQKTIQTQMPQIVTFEHMLSNNIVMNQGLILKERVFQVGLYDEELYACQDYDLWMRLILHFGAIKVIATPTQIINIDPNLQRISSASKQKFKGYFRFYCKYKKYMNDFQRKQHLCRVYGIRTAEVTKNALAVKLLMAKILKQGWHDFTIFGVGELYEELLPHLLSQNLVINMLVDSTKVSNEIVIHKPSDALETGEKRFVVASSSFYPQMKESLLALAQKMQKNIEVITI